MESPNINDILLEGARDGIGAGEAIGRYIWENNLPHVIKSVLAAAYKNHLPRRFIESGMI